TFIGQDNDTKIIESFEAEETNAIEMQQAGWQAILDNFKKYVETAKEE
ncbi:MAG: polyketide cyclase, partial [Paenibacillus sp.]|nr:polyketide cyclase [Paenibacillus sp.]